MSGISSGGSTGPIWSNTTVPEGRIVGRAAGGDVAALTAAQVGALSPWHASMVAGEYYAPAGTIGTSISAEGAELTSVIIPTRSCTIDQIAVYMTVAGSAGAVVRLGIRSLSLSTAMPGAVLADGGAVDATGAAGALTATVSVPVVAGVPIVLSATIQGGASTRPTLVRLSGKQSFHGVTAPSAATSPNVFASGVTGSLSDSPTWTRGDVAVPRIWVRTSTP